GHDHDAAALGLREDEGSHPTGHAGLHRLVADGGLLHLRAGHQARSGDHEPHLHLSGEIRVHGQLALVAVLDLRAVLLNHLADQRGIQGALHHRAAGGDGHVHHLLAAEATAAAAVALLSTAATRGPDAADHRALTGPTTAGLG